MTTRTYSILAGIIGTAFGAWWWRKRSAVRSSNVADTHGRIIYDNTPMATGQSEGRPL